MRSYNSSMYGILSTPTPDSSKVGTVRQLSYDPKILNIRGMFDMDRTSRNTNTNIYCPTEMMNNFTATHADPPRTNISKYLCIIAYHSMISKMCDSYKKLYV